MYCYTFNVCQSVGRLSPNKHLALLSSVEAVRRDVSSCHSIDAEKKLPGSGNAIKNNDCNSTTLMAMLDFHQIVLWKATLKRFHCEDIYCFPFSPPSRCSVSEEEAINNFPLELTGYAAVDTEKFSFIAFSSGGAPQTTARAIQRCERQPHLIIHFQHDRKSCCLIFISFRTGCEAAGHFLLSQWASVVVVRSVSSGALAVRQMKPN